MVCDIDILPRYIAHREKFLFNIWDEASVIWIFHCNVLFFEFMLLVTFVSCLIGADEVHVVDGKRWYEESDHNEGSNEEHQARKLHEESL